MPNCEHEAPPPELESGQEHDWCFATRLCRLCGASQRAVARGDRARYCEPGVTGISWVRATERIRDQMASFEEAFGPMASVPLLTEADLIKAAADHIANPPPFSVGGFRFPDGSLDDCADEPPSPPSAA